MILYKYYILMNLCLNYIEMHRWVCNALLRIFNLCWVFYPNSVYMQRKIKWNVKFPLNICFCIPFFCLPFLSFAIAKYLFQDSTPSINFFNFGVNEERCILCSILYLQKIGRFHNDKKICILVHYIEEKLSTFLWR